MIEINKATLHYFECGEGEPIVFVHGGLGDLHTFRAQAQTFAPCFRVIAYSRRYHPPNAPPRAEDVNPLSVHVGDLGALIKELKATPAHFVGTLVARTSRSRWRWTIPSSCGAWFSASRPSSAVGEAVRQSWVRGVIEPSRRALENESLEEGLRQFFDGICGRTGCFDNFPQSERTELVEKQALGFRLEMMTEMSAYMPPLNCGDLGKLKRPTLLVTGERSPAVFLLRRADSPLHLP